MWVKQGHKPPGNGNHTTYKNGDFFSDGADGTVLPTFINPRDFLLLTHHLIYRVDNHY